MNRLVIQGHLITDRQLRNDQILVCEDGKIAHVGPSRGETPDLVVESGYIAPGYVDIHIHGCKGYDVMDGTFESLAGIARSLTAYGVTGFLATTLTAHLERLLQVVAVCREFAERQQDAGVDAGERTQLGARLLGIHLEGPWLNAKYKGAQNEAHIAPPSLDDAKRLLEAAGGLLKIVTLAPEQSQAGDVIQYLSEQGVKASVGHSDATYEHVKAALAHGLAHVTHCCNGMRGFHHREPGVIGAAMYHDELTAELIADGIHVHPVVMSILHRLKTTDRMVLVSDGMRAVGMPDGEYELGGLRVCMQNGEARLADGTLAGSTLTLERAVQNMVRLCGVPIADAVAMASEIPARAIGFGDRKGRLAAGYDADFVVLDESLHVIHTFVGGQRLSIQG
ncbi:N-acetylglucosamine-6-phosphate deacetylase [Effusibacillus pohliae]|uniref:N-acetylglucosamine-6-phosphate deacetylase n=1 Tax=Effusibacillus pohliae TaxID=232270 RepID=UPI000366F9CC|nr:N-acetylglucosamine-6-phosphate deacetylase [Effusibacillus pohliae]